MERRFKKYYPDKYYPEFLSQRYLIIKDKIKQEEVRVHEKSKLKY